MIYCKCIYITQSGTLSHTIHVLNMIMLCNIYFSIFIYDTNTWSILSENKIRIIKHCSWFHRQGKLKKTDKELACVPVEST